MQMLIVLEREQDLPLPSSVELQPWSIWELEGPETLEPSIKDSIIL